MTTIPKWLRFVGFGIHLLIGGLMIFAGSMKAFGFAPPEMVEGMTKGGLGDQIRLIGTGELIAAALLIVPWTKSLGVLVASGFWGGVICFHMSHGESYAMGAALLALTWLAAGLREPRTFASFGCIPQPASGAPSMA